MESKTEIYTQDEATGEIETIAITETADKNELPKDTKRKKIKKAEDTGKEKFISVFGRVVRRIFIWIVCTLLMLVAGLYLLIHMVIFGPSSYVKELFVVSAAESSVGGKITQLYLSDEEIETIRAKNKTEVSDEITDTSLIHFENSKVTYSDEEETAGSAQNGTADVDPDGDGIDVYDISGPTYIGKMMIVYDPSRIILGVCDTFSEDVRGLTLPQLCRKYNAVAGINGGMYTDTNGMGTGGMPKGVVIAGGQLLLGDPDTVYTTYGFTNNNVLVVGSMTPTRALEIGVRDAVSFGPTLIVNGTPASVYGSSSGLNPRTAIGQREDGAVLMLVIEGRQAYSVGATYSDLIDIMLEYGAINAANLDGGMSSTMYFNDELIIQSASMNSSRCIPTGFVVLAEEE